MSAVVFLLVCFLSCSVSEDQQLQLITARPGRDVTLPCRAPNNVTIAAVEWTRSNLERYIYFQSDGHLNTADQDPSYVNRVQLKDDEMKNGDLSLILKNVNNNDEGTYECRYMERGGRWESGYQIKLIVYLKVAGRQITAQPGDNVTLSCQAPNDPIIAAVEWIRSDPERYVFFKRGGRLVTADQDPSYENRVQLKDDEMKNGDLSLILKNVNNNDEGTYVCGYVEERGGRRKRSAFDGELISSVHLDVKGGDSESGKHKHQHLEVILPVTLIAILVDVGLVSFVIYKKLKGRSENNSDPPDDPDVLQQLQENENSQKNITNNISDTQV